MLAARSGGQSRASGSDTRMYAAERLERAARGVMCRREVRELLGAGTAARDVILDRVAARRVEAALDALEHRGARGAARRGGPERDHSDASLVAGLGRGSSSSMRR